MKKVAIVCLIALLSASAYADFDWFNTSTNRLYYNGGSTPLVGSQSDSSVGCFVQLIWAGTDNTINGAVLSGTGVTGDDQVQATTWVGGTLFTGPAGRYTGGSTFTADSAGLYYVRFWTAPAFDYAGGLVPTSGTNFYGNTALWSNPGTEPPGTADVFNNIPNGGVSATLTASAIPEPTIVGLGLIGLLTLRLYRRRK
ncbi:MAG TPA: hypothetical protein PLE77_08445 [Kiritimatiellia bacterium]|mgnify:CR=1 FL=1|nr:hypothetical protein [Kiritimatiellia bacterium]